MDAGKREIRVLVQAVGFVRVVGGHEKRSVDFEAPGTALDGSRGGKFGEVSEEQGKFWITGMAKSGLTGPWKTPSFLCSLGLESGFPLIAYRVLCRRSTPAKNK